MITFDELYNKFVPKKYRIPISEGTCRKCKKPIFTTDSKFGKEHLCIYCYEAFNEGKAFTENKKLD